MVELGDELAGAHALLHRQRDGAEPLAPLRALAAQLVQAADAPLLARAPRFHAPADPGFLLRQQLVEFLVDGGFLGELLRLALLEGGEAAGK